MEFRRSFNWEEYPHSIYGDFMFHIFCVRYLVPGLGTDCTGGGVHCAGGGIQGKGAMVSTPNDEKIVEVRDERVLLKPRP